MTDTIPLAETLRPKSLDDVIGQQHLVGPNGIVRKLLASSYLPSLILWGPPGVGKTTLAELLATLTNAHFESHSAVTSKLEDIRRVVKEAEERRLGQYPLREESSTNREVIQCSSRLRLPRTRCGARTIKQCVP